MTESVHREWRVYIDHTLDFTGRVLTATAVLDQPDFVANSLAQDATVRNLGLIREAAIHVANDVRGAILGFPGG